MRKWFAALNDMQVKIPAYSLPLFSLALSFVVSYTMLSGNAPSTKPTDYRLSLPKEQLVDLQISDEGECAGAFKLSLDTYKEAFPESAELCTHGPDLAEDESNPFGLIDSSTPKTVECYGDGQNGQRIQALYAVSNDRPDRYDELTPFFKQITHHINNIVDTSASKTGGSLKVKWVTDSNCEVDIKKIIMQPEGDDSFANTIAEAKLAGYGDLSKKYLIWTDASLYCGIGLIFQDDNPEPAFNRSSADSRYTTYSRIDNRCWGRFRSTETHELFHNFGAVQNSAPNASAGHCTDGYDLMCPQYTPNDTCSFDQISYLDCNNDDYLHSDPPEGSYLAAHWNTFNIPHMYSFIPEDTEPPLSPELVATENSEGHVSLGWNKPQGEEGPISYKLFRREYPNEIDYVRIASTETNEFIDTDVSEGRTFWYKIIAIDDFGNESVESKRESITLGSNNDPQADDQPPSKATNISAKDVSHNGFNLAWKIPQASDVWTTKIVLNDAEQYTFYDDREFYSVCCSLSPGTKYKVQILLSDTAGNKSLSDPIYVTTKTISSDPTSPTGPDVDVPYNLQITEINGAEITMTATIDSIVEYGDGVSYGFEVLRKIGSSTKVGLVKILPTSSVHKTYTFKDRMAYPQEIDGYWIRVSGEPGVYHGTSNFATLNFTGSPESNNPPVPTNISVSQSGGAANIQWDKVIDDSGVAHHYEISVTGPSFSFYDGSTGNGRIVYGTQPATDYTATIVAVDIWGNKSSPAVYNFTTN